MTDKPEKDGPTPAKPKNIPRPGTIPKLPQTIFNLEKRDSGAEPQSETDAPDDRV